MQLNLRYLQACSYDTRMFGTSGGWVRLFGYGLRWRINPQSRPDWLSFSERYGYRRSWRLGRLVVGTITPAN